MPRDPGAPVGGPAGLLRRPDGRPRRPGRDRAGVVGRSAGRRRGGARRGAPRSSWSGGSAGGSSAAAGPPRAAPRWWPSGSPVLGRPAGPGPPSRPRSGRSAPSRDPRDRQLDTRRSAARTLGGPWRRGPPDARSGHRWTSRACSATRPSSLLTHESKGIPKDDLHLPGPDFVDRVFATTDRSPAGAAQPAAAVRPRPPRRHRLRVDPARSTRASSTRPRRRSPRTRSTSTRRTSSSWPSRAAATRWPRPSACSASVSRTLRPPHPVHREAQPQRAADLPEQVRPDHVRLGRAGLRPGRGRRRRHDLLRLRRVDPPDPGGQRGLRRGPRARHVHRAVVLPAQQRVQDRTTSTTTSPPTSPARPTTSASPSRPTSSSRSCPRTTAATTRSRATARPASSSTTSSPPTTRSTSCRWQVANCYMGRIGLINRGGESQGRQRPGRGGAHRRHQQAGRRHGPDLRPQGVPAPDGRGRRAAQRHPGRLPRRAPSPSPDRRAIGTRRAGDPVRRGISNAIARGATTGNVADTVQHPTRPGRQPGRRSTGSSSASPATPATACSSPATASPAPAPLFGNDLATLPDFPAEIRAPAGTLAGVSAFQVHISDHDITTPGDAPNVLVAMNPAALQAELEHARAGRHADRQHRHLRRAQPGQGRLRRQPARRRQPRRLHGLRGADDHRSPRRRSSRPRREAPRRRAVEELLRPRPRLVDVHPAGRADARLDRRALRAKTAGAATPTLAAFKAGHAFGETAELFDHPYEVQPAKLRAGHLHEHHRQHRAGLGPRRRRPAGRACRCSSARYPITPASDILHELSKHKNFGVRTLQAEDEIAGIGAALGAAFGGHLGVTTTSGPGMALKGETMGLAVSLELPLLIIDIQRGGPVHRPAHQDRGGRPAAWPCTAATASRRCRSWPPTARRTASTRPSRRPASRSSTARR